MAQCAEFIIGRPKAGLDGLLRPTALQRNPNIPADSARRARPKGKYFKTELFQSRTIPKQKYSKRELLQKRCLVRLLPHST
jgi:hypothetical protein